MAPPSLTASGIEKKMKQERLVFPWQPEASVPMDPPPLFLFLILLRKVR